MRRIVFLVLLQMTLLLQVKALDSQKPATGDGTSSNPYLIATAENLKWFVLQVNNGKASICGKLTADVNLGGDQTMIGTFAGTFDGDNHAVNVAYNTTDWWTALFRYTNGATIKNLVTTGSITTTGCYAAGICAQAKSTTIRNCQSNITITCNFTTSDIGWHGGIVGKVLGNVTLENVLFNGKLLGPNATTCGGLVGYSCGVTIKNSLFAPQEVTFSSKNFATLAVGYDDVIHISNCYYNIDFGKKQGTNVTNDMLKSGEVCYNLNGGVTDGTQSWYQTLNTDDTPLPYSSHCTVYGGGEACPSTLNYSNNTHTASATYTDGYSQCTNNNCSAKLPESANKASDGYYEIANSAQMEWFANRANYNTEVINGRLTANVTMPATVMIGTAANPYKGIFDGNGHTVTVAYNTTEAHTALFRYTKGATIKNLTTTGSVTTTKQFAAGIAAYTESTTISNCQSDVVITCNYESASDGTHAGIVARVYSSGTLENVLFNGKLLGENATNCGGLVGWSENGVTIKNSLFAPQQVTFSTSNSSTLSRGNSVSISNCYYATALGTTQGTNATADMLSSGEVCYGFNEGVTDGTQSWYQTLGTDYLPVLDHSHGIVYGGSEACPSTSSYSNHTHTSSETYTDDGYSQCTTTGCSAQLPQPATLSDGYYVITNNGQMEWFTNRANHNTEVINGRLEADVTMPATVMIGTAVNPYKGIFDGNDHIVTVAYNTTEAHTALFRYTKGATIKNLATSGSVTTTKQFAAGIAAYTESTTISNCQSDVVITCNYESASDGTHAGIVARVYSSGTLENVLFNGKLLGEKATNCGGLVGYSADGVTIKNSLFAPQKVTFSSESSSTLSRGKSVSISNCYYATALGTTQGTNATADMLSSGEVCYNLNEGNTTDPKWHQTIGSDNQPLLLSSNKDIVYAKGHYAITGYTNKCDEVHDPTAASYGDEGVATCEKCSQTIYEPAIQLNKADAYSLKNRGNFIWLSKMIECKYLHVDSIDFIADIDLKDSQEMLGTLNNMLNCSVNGNHHTLTINYISSERGCAPFRFAQDINIKDLKVTGSITTTGSHAAGLVGQSGYVANEDPSVSGNTPSVGTATFTNVICDVKITGNQTDDGDYYIGGFMGWVAVKAVIDNCAFTGSIVAPHNKNMCCFVPTGYWNQNKNHYEVYISNSYCFPQDLQGVKLTESNSSKTSYSGIFGSGYKYCDWNSDDIFKIDNCYWCYSKPDDVYKKDGTQVSEADIYGGSLPGKLGSTWYQDMTSNSSLPLPFHTSNSDFCSDGGTIHISNEDRLDTIATRVNNGADFAGSTFYLDRDMDLSERSLAPIGTSDHTFNGTFDGQFHRIKNLKINSTSQGVGFIGYTGSGATVKNLILDSSCSITSSNSHIGSIVGWGDNITLLSCGNEAAVTGTGNVGGLVGTSANATIKNCYNAGTITATNGNATATIGYTEGSKIYNTYNSGTIKNYTSGYPFVYYLGGSGSTSVTNCYDINGGNGAAKVTTGELASGAVCNNLNSYINSQSDAEKANYHLWIQVAGDTIPYLDRTVTENNSYLRFTAQEAGAVVSFGVQGTLTNTPTLQYSQNGSTWTDYNLKTDIITLTNVGDYVMFRAKDTNTTFSQSDDIGIRFSSTKKVAASGNIISLLDNTCKQTTVPEHAFNGLFTNCTTLTVAPQLPFTDIQKCAYLAMFKGCTGLTMAPALPATTLSEFCYKQMFMNCTGLISAPELPATTMLNWCYESMFYGCSKLTQVPELPATALARSCYMHMFQNCTSLTVAPRLPATTLQMSCYREMFSGCTNLTTAPQLQATTLEQSCYYEMFSGCSNLNKVVVRFTEWDTTRTSEENSTGNWLSGVASTGTFYYYSGLDVSTTRGTSTVPEGWTAVCMNPSVTLNGYGLATYSAPVDLTISTSDVNAYKASIENNTIKLTKLDGYIPAGTGVFLYGKDMAGTEVKFQVPSSTEAADVSDNDFLPTTTATESLVSVPTSGTKWVLSGGSFVKYTGSTFKANRAYLIYELPSSARMSFLFDDDTETGIEELRNSGTQELRDSIKCLENGWVVILKNGKRYTTAGQIIK